MYKRQAELLDVDDRENGGMASSFWNSHEQTWNGRDSATFLGDELKHTEPLHTETSDPIHQAAGHGTEVIERTTAIVQKTFTERFEESGIEREFGLQLTPNNQVIDLGNKVLGIDILYNVRSRNIEVVGKRLKPNTRYYVFMENVDMTAYAVPKLLPVVMTRGSFSTGDLMYSVENPPGTAGKPSIHFRLTSSNPVSYTHLRAHET